MVWSGILATCCLVALVPSSDANDKSAWQKVFEVTDRGSWLTSVWARSETEWFAGGKGFIVRSQNGFAEKTFFPGKVILDFGPRDAPIPFAVGSGQFVARLDGTKWVQEHEGHSPIQDRNRGQYSDDLFGAGYLEEGPAAPLVAFGPYAILTRRPDGTWSSPADTDQSRLRDVALLGPRASQQASCAAPGWLWLGRGVGWFNCQDNSAFLLDAGKLEPLGKLPSGCRFHISASAFVRGTLYVSCGAHGFWRSTAGGWRTMRGPKDIRSIALMGRCMFVATMHAVWRKCDADDAPAT